MNDLILRVRIDALKRDLEWADEAKDWLRKKLSDPLPDEFTDELWGTLAATIRKQATSQIKALNKICEDVKKEASNGPEAEKRALNQAWHSYAKIYRESRRVFGEYLDFIGGLAIRYEELDERICCIADELIKRCSKDSIGTPWHSLSVLATQESFSKTLARIIRLRFPESTIWALPFAAHEYGHVVAAEVGEVEQFIEDKVEHLIEQNEEYQAKTEKQAKDRIRRRIKNHINVLFADAFATYTMGPAYACAAIFLRFDPVNADTDTDELPSDARRAFIVFETLKRMDQEGGGSELKPLYTPVIGELERYWKEMLDRARSAGMLNNPAQAGQINEQQLFEGIWETLKPPALLKEAQYPTRSNKEGWAKVLEWEEKLAKRPVKGEITILPSPTDNLRDVLNAAWLCRLYPENINDHEKIRIITDNAIALCEAIKNLQRNTGGTPQPPKMPGKRAPRP